jgi:hypothetical protein
MPITGFVLGRSIGVENFLRSVVVFVYNSTERALRWFGGARYVCYRAL